MDIDTSHDVLRMHHPHSVVLPHAQSHGTSALTGAVQGRAWPLPQIAYHGTTG